MPFGLDGISEPQSFLKEGRWAYLMVASNRYPSFLKYFRIAFFLTIAIIGLFLVMVWTRAYYGSMKSYERGKALMEKGQYVEAVTFFDRCLHWYTPFNPYIQNAAEKLWQISSSAEESGDIRLAVIAVKTLRRGFISARSFYVPGKDWIGRCDDRIHRLVTDHKLADGKGENGVLAKSSILDARQVKGPDVLWTFLMLVGLLGWILCAIVIIFKTFKTAGNWKSAILSNGKWVAGFAVSWVTWLFGMIRA